MIDDNMPGQGSPLDMEDHPLNTGHPLASQELSHDQVPTPQSDPRGPSRMARSLRTTYEKTGASEAQTQSMLTGFDKASRQKPNK